MGELKVLLAEDNHRLGNLISYMLEQEKAEVEWVLDGEMAMECALA